MAAVVAVVGRCTARAPRDGSGLGLEAIARARLLLGCGSVCVPVPVLSSFRAMRVFLFSCGFGFAGRAGVWRGLAVCWVPIPIPSPG